jgi:hypothetical protein
MSDWGQGAKNNDIGWGQGAVNNNISWGSAHENSWAGDTDIVGENAIAPVNTIAPVVSGTNTVGSLLTTTNGTWSGSLPITYTYQWLRNGLNISGATSSTYTLVTADTSNVVSCRVTATNALGSANAVSNSLTIYEAEYKAILDYATTNSYALPSTVQRLKQNTLLSSLKTAGIWAKLDTFANFATNGSTQFALIDWKRLVQYNASTGPTFTTNEGFMGNGSSSYIDTNFKPSTQNTNYILNNASRYAYVFSGANGQRFDGNDSDSNNMRIGTYATHKINSGTVNTLNANFTYTATKEMKSIHRTSSTAVTLYNAAVGENRTLLSTGLPDVNQLIFKAGGAYVNTKISMYAMGASMITENTAFVNAFDTYLNSL